MEGGRFFTIGAARHQDGLIVIQFHQCVDNVQAVGHHGDIIELGQMRRHLQHGTARIEDQRITIIDQFDGSVGDLALFFRC